MSNVSLGVLEFDLRLPEGQQEFPEPEQHGAGPGEGLRLPDHPEQQRVPARHRGAGGGPGSVQHGDSQDGQEASRARGANPGRSGQNQLLFSWGLDPLVR